MKFAGVMPGIDTYVHVRLITWATRQDYRANKAIFVKLTSKVCRDDLCAMS